MSKCSIKKIKRPYLKKKKQFFFFEITILTQHKLGITMTMKKNVFNHNSRKYNLL